MKKVKNSEIQSNDLVKDKKNILFLRYVLLGLILTFIHALFDYYYGKTNAAIADVVAFSLLLSIYLLAYQGNRYFLAKILFLITANAIIFILSSIFPKEEGIYLIFFPLVTTLFTIFEVKHEKISFVFAFISLACVVTLEATDYQPFGEILLEENSADHSFLVNLIVGMLVVIFSINFMVKINKKAEDHLRSNQENLKKLTLEIQKQNDVLAKTNSELDRFVYSTSHDLRSPLMSILGLLHLAEKDKIENQSTYLEKIKKQVKKLDDFIKDIISYSRNTRVKVMKESIDLGLMIEEIKNDLQFMEGASRIAFHTDIAFHDKIKCDKSRLSVILHNLIANAIKYHDFDKKDPYIRINADVENSKLILSICDNGPGIPEKYQKDVFQMFFRASENSQGSGLGLYIVKEMLEKLNGKIALQSEEGKGSTFTIEIPRVF